MIKINVLDSKVNPAEELNLGQGISMSNEPSGNLDNKEAMVKVFIILLPALLMFFYEKYAIGELEDKRNAISSQVQEQVQQIAALKQKAGKATEYEDEAKKLDEKLSILMALSKKRLRELKALDYLQNILPDGVWLKTIDYDGSKVNFQGGAINDKDLSSFVTSLETSNYFQSVIVVKAIEKKEGRRGFKEFEINSVLGDLE